MNGSNIVHTTASMAYRRSYGLVSGSVMSFSYTPFSAHEPHETDEMATITGIPQSEYIIRRYFLTRVSTVTCFHSHD
jgi:hypothetical protein